MATGSITIKLPPSTKVVVQAFANAAYQQRVTIQPIGQQPIVFTGSGYYDDPMGQTVLSTPAGPALAVTVSVDHSQDGGKTWTPSLVDWLSCQVMFYALVTVVSEDSTNNTWDDATTYFTWTALPPESVRKPAPFKAEKPLYTGRA